MSDIIECTIDNKTAMILKRCKEAQTEYLWLLAQEAIRQSIDDAPLDTGTLRRSGVVTLGKLPNADEVYKTAQGGNVESDKPNTFTNVSYASYNTPYAAHLHEWTGWKARDWKYSARGVKIPKPAVGHPKWLRLALPKVTKKSSALAKRAIEKAGL